MANGGGGLRFGGQTHVLFRCGELNYDEFELVHRGLGPFSNGTRLSMSVETNIVGNASADRAGQATEQPSLPSSEGCPSPLGWAEVLQSFRAESADWSVEVEGSLLRGRSLGRGRPLYFLNGISGNCELFCLVAWLLRDDFRCVLFDYRNSDTKRLTAIRLVDDLIAVADAQQDRTFSIFAAPFGSLVALSALVEYPERIERAILLGGFAHRRLSPFERLLCGFGHYLPGDLSRVPLRSTLQRASHQRGFPPFDASRWDFFAQNTSQTPIRDLAERARLMATFDLRGKLPRIERPVLLIRTEHEGAVFAAAEEELERELPQVSSESIPLAGQLAYLTHPHRVAKAVRSFLGEPSSQQQASCEAIGLDNSCCADHKDESL
jgi:pimeloyl-ACP methyl ester carboxylesterase